MIPISCVLMPIVHDSVYSWHTIDGFFYFLQAIGTYAVGVGRSSGWRLILHFTECTRGRDGWEQGEALAFMADVVELAERELGGRVNRLYGLLSFFVGEDRFDVVSLASGSAPLCNLSMSVVSLKLVRRL